MVATLIQWKELYIIRRRTHWKDLLCHLYSFFKKKTLVNSSLYDAWFPPSLHLSSPPCHNAYCKWRPSAFDMCIRKKEVHKSVGLWGLQWSTYISGINLYETEESLFAFVHHIYKNLFMVPNFINNVLLYANTIRKLCRLFIFLYRQNRLMTRISH